MKNQKGFSVVIALLAIIVISLTIFVGYYVWDSQQDKKNVNDSKTAQNTPTTTSDNPQKQANTQQNTNTISYLIVKEWGIRVPVDESVKGLAYSTNPGVPGGYAFVTDDFKSIVGDCGASTVFLVRGKANDKLSTETGEGSGPTFLANYQANEYKNYPSSPRSINLVLGDYYYTYPLMASGTCSSENTKSQQELSSIEKIVSALKKAELN